MVAYSYLEDEYDPWADVDDLDGDQHYKALEVSPKATTDEIKAAFRRLARVHHPDKGGDPAKFSAVQKAWEVLSDPTARQTYDDWAKELRFRYIPGVTPKAEGGEDILLDEFETLGLGCDARTQLVVLCEVCGRPSTKICYICECNFCDFCTRKQHWKGKFGLHWPMVNSPTMKVQLAKKELEKKRIEDARNFLLEDPNFREEWELQEMREFKREAEKIYASSNSVVTYDLRLAKYYMWAQTSCFVYLTVFVPTGYEDKELEFLPSQHDVKLQPEDSPPIIHRVWAFPVDTSQPLETFKSADNRMFTVAVAKAEVGKPWPRVFQGDPDGARCLRPPYTLKESQDDVVMEIELPFWIDAGDCAVDITRDEVRVRVRNQLDLRRSFWKNKGEEKSKRNYAGVVVPEESMWSLDEEVSEAGEEVKVLMVTLVKPPLTEDEVQWKRGKRMDNRNHDRRDGAQRKGYRFFLDDEDSFGQEDILQALCFLEAGEAWVPAKPWEQYHYPFAEPKLATKLEQLSEGACKHIDMMLQDQGDDSEPEPDDADDDDDDDEEDED